MGIEPTSDSDCRSTVLKLGNRTSLTWAGRAFSQVRGLIGSPPLSPADPFVPLLMAREWHAERAACEASTPQDCRQAGMRASPRPIRRDVTGVIWGTQTKASVTKRVASGADKPDRVKWSARPFPR